MARNLSLLNEMLLSSVSDLRYTLRPTWRVLIVMHQTELVLHRVFEAGRMFLCCLLPFGCHSHWNLFGIPPLFVFSLLCFCRTPFDDQWQFSIFVSFLYFFISFQLHSSCLRPWINFQFFSPPSPTASGHWEVRNLRGEPVTAAPLDYRGRIQNFKRGRPQGTHRWA